MRVETASLNHRADAAFVALAETMNRRIAPVSRCELRVRVPRVPKAVQRPLLRPGIEALLASPHPCKSAAHLRGVS